MKEETVFKLKIQKELSAIPGIWFYKTQEVSVRGIPDIIGCFRGRFFAIELKKDMYSDADPLQKFILDKIKNARGLAFVWHPGNYRKQLEEFFMPELSKQRIWRKDIHETRKNTKFTKV